LKNAYIIVIFLMPSLLARDNMNSPPKMSGPFTVHRPECKKFACKDRAAGAKSYLNFAGG
jgi:hypothetical protein